MPNKMMWPPDNRGAIGKERSLGYWKMFQDSNGIMDEQASKVWNNTGKR